MKPLSGRPGEAKTAKNVKMALHVASWNCRQAVVTGRRVGELPPRESVGLAVSAFGTCNKTQEKEKKESIFLLHENFTMLK